MNVSLLTHTPDPVMLMAAGAMLCYSAGGPKAAWEKARTSGRAMKLVEELIEQDHGSVLEHPSFTFGIEGVSRACSHQLVRHRICSFSQQSMRYVNLASAEQDWYVYPKAIHPELDAGSYSDMMADAMNNYVALLETISDYGLEGELANQDARFVLPNATKTNLIWTVNFRELMHVSHVRLCRRAQWEIREMMEAVQTSMTTAFDQQVVWLSKFLRPQCEAIGYCTQGSRSCGLHPTKEQVLAGYRKFSEVEV